MDENLAVIKFFAKQYLMPRLGRRPPYNSFLNNHMEHEWEHQFKNLSECISNAKFLYANSWRPEDTITVLQPEAIAKLVERTSRGLDFHNSVARTVGLLECLDSHYETIVKVIKVEYFPEAERGILQQFGVEDPDEDLAAIVYIMKEEIGRCKNKSECRISEKLDNAKEYLRKAADAANLSTQVKDEDKKFIKSPRWFKGLGQIAQGTAISLANLALGLGILSFPVSPETKTWGALVSATTGVGQILTGIGEIRGE